MLHADAFAQVKVYEFLLVLTWEGTFCATQAALAIRRSLVQTHFQYVCNDDDDDDDDSTRCVVARIYVTYTRIGGKCRLTVVRTRNAYLNT